MTQPPHLPLAAGQSVTIGVTVTEQHVLGFAEITGDFSPNHVDEAYMRGTPYGRRIAHGALIVGYMSQASTKIAQLAPADILMFPVSLGYDRIRLLKPVFIGDTLTIHYRIDTIDAQRLRSIGAVTVAGADGNPVAIGVHIMKWLPRQSG
jgi:acyl dehydratase